MKKNSKKKLNDVKKILSEFIKDKKKVMIVCSICAIIIILIACLVQRINFKNRINPNSYVTPNEKVDIFDFDSNYKNKKVSVVYFDTDDSIKDAADKIAEIFEAKVTKIEPQVPYTDEDLNIYDKNSRINKEREFEPYEAKYYGDVVYGDELDENGETLEKADDDRIVELPKIKKVNVGNADIVFVGYPIWLNEAPRVIYTFINDANLKNKTIIPFSVGRNGDRIEPSDQNIANFADENVYFMGGEMLKKDESIDEIKDWITRIGVDINVR